MATKKTEAPNFLKYIKWFWITILGGTLAIVLIFLLASWGVFGALPTFEELENPENNLEINKENIVFPVPLAPDRYKIGLQSIACWNNTSIMAEVI